VVKTVQSHETRHAQEEGDEKVPYPITKRKGCAKGGKKVVRREAAKEPLERRERR